MLVGQPPIAEETVAIKIVPVTDIDAYRRNRHASDWARARLEGAYRPASLALEGYVHFSTPWQVPRIADGNFPGRDDPVALVVDPERLGVELRYENCEGGIEPFPHVYFHGWIPDSYTRW